MPRRRATGRSAAGGFFVAVVALWATAAGAQTTGPAAPAPAPPAGAPAAVPEMTPPSLDEHPQAPYPAQALAAGVEGNVGLELDVDATGKVTDVRVTSPAGHGFDEAALAAARRFTFTPARRDGVAIPSTIQFTYEFHLPPPLPPPPAPPPPPSAPAAPLQVGPNQSTLVLATRPISAASAFAVQDRDFQLRPIGGVQDILRVTPGLVVVQHSGGGKANQYFLRGFDADHGTDLALSIDGVPINLVSHAHGQGFADTNFIIPEVVERVEITKGPYFVSQGDFATAGAVNMISRAAFEHSAAALGLSGSPGHGEAGYRGLVIASPSFDAAPALKATFAAEVGRNNGPFEHPEGWDRYKLFNKLAISPTPVSEIAISEMSYAGNWHGSGQIPARAVEQGIISRFGSLDPDEGGNTARHQVAAVARLRPGENSALDALAYAGTYRFNLYSNFTLYLRDPVNGDEIEQIDRRTFYGGRLHYRVAHRIGRLRLETTVGADGRNDDIHEELWDTAQRQQRQAVRSNDVHESFVGAYVNQEIAPARWLRALVGGRADLVSFAVDNRLVTGDPTAPQSGVGAAHQLSPKASLIVTPADGPGAQLDVYANYGHGFHSNDVRGVFSQPAVTPLARARGGEIGARGRFFDRWDLAAAAWRLDLDSETVWNGDQGTTTASDPTTRQGIEAETRYEVTPWLAADLALTFTRSRFVSATDHANGGGLALAPKRTWAGGISGRQALGPGVARAGLRFYGIGDRPATDDGALVAPGFTQVDLHLGYRHRRFDIALDVENLLDSTFRSAQFATTSRLPGEPAIGAPVPAGFGCGSNGRLAAAPDGGAANGRFFGCEDINYTPAYPLTVRLLATLFLD
ncbi:MAG TPA: TonB family protein [Polyangia bacterium]|nr:TonB family protein [Polyangia bacterium]